MMRRIVVPAAVIAMGMLLAASAAACGDDDDDAAPGAAGISPETGSSVAVTLKEFEVLPDRDSVPAGSVRFSVTNVGPEDVHEIVVMKTDLAPDALPTGADGSVDEEGAGIEVIGEIEDIAVDGEAEVTLDLAAGKYVLLCNIYDAEEVEAHYAEGMRTAFTVE